MATLNLPAWGYGLRYKYGLFKQRFTKEGQEEIAEDWLEVWFHLKTLPSIVSSWNAINTFVKNLQKFSPWEIVRHDIVYPVRFFGHVEVNPNES